MRTMLILAANLPGGAATTPKCHSLRLADMSSEEDGARYETTDEWRVVLVKGPKKQAKRRHEAPPPSID